MCLLFPEEFTDSKGHLAPIIPISPVPAGAASL